MARQNEPLKLKYRSAALDEVPLLTRLNQRKGKHGDSRP
jgi:hypothetical protein